ncbi:MAG: nucleotidyltransferase domain-containing protein [Nanoarchaeota archaeon]
MLAELVRREPDARKIFGKKEIGIILKQMDGISLTQSEKNRLSRDIRPKLRFIKKISRAQDEFELKKSEGVKKLIDRAVKLILEDKLKYKIKAILLFGSRVNGIVTPRSDIDICVIFTEINLTEATKFRIRILGDFSEKVDIQVFNVLPQKIKREIARKHKILYRTKNYDNIEFNIRHLKDDDYFIRTKKYFGERKK